MIVVADSSPLITLSKIGQVHLLRALYETVYVTPEVYAEVVVAGAGLSGSAEIAEADWVRVQTAQHDSTIGPEDRAALGVADISTIVLAKQLSADIALMDDRRVRTLALKHGLTPLGCVGILHSAFLKGYVTDLHNAYQRLLASGAYVDRRLIDANLRALNLPGLDLR